MKYEKIISIPCLIKAKEKKGITDPIYANISISEEKGSRIKIKSI